MEVRKFILFACGIIALSHASVQAQQLYVGVNYHPHDDKRIDKVKSDILTMKKAGFSVVRMGHLAWDSYEPKEGQFDFKWFDAVMDEMAKAHIKVILDVAVRPAPLWLHHNYPSVNVADANGNVTYSNTRYMEDSGDPTYQKYALRYTDSISKHYANHPALLAFGVDNEPGYGKISYSEGVRKRFIQWLKNKYQTTDNLNQAWAGWRWSRKVGDWDELFLPANTTTSPEKALDFMRFHSDELNTFYLNMLDIIHKNAPKALTNTNGWYYATPKYYDYAPTAYSGKMTREGNGFYPGTSLQSNDKLKDALFGITRIQYETKNPFWCNEFTSFTATPGAVRKYAYLTLMYGNEMVCGWTWQTMRAGEEKFLQGLMDWDGKTNEKYEEYKQIATEFKKIEKYFPYQVDADVALGFSYPSQMARGWMAPQHDAQIEQCFNVMFDRNRDVRFIDIARSDLQYKLLIVAGMSVMDETTAAKIRDFVKKGGTVIMTGGSAALDEHGQVFASTLPGRLSDVFGIRVGGYGQTKDRNELSRVGFSGDQMIVVYKDKTWKMNSERYDLITAQGAEILGKITSLDTDYPIITSHPYGKGQAIYVGLPADENIMGQLIDELTPVLGLKQGPDVPKGISARWIDSKHLLLFNMTSKPIEVKASGKSLLTGKKYTGSLVMPAQEPEFIEVK